MEQRSTSYRRVEKGIYERSGKFLFKYRQDGKVKWSEGFLSVEAAREAKATRHTQLQARKAGEETVDSFTERWTADYPRSPQTNHYYAERTGKFGQDFEGRTLRSITRIEAREWALENPSRVRAVKAMFSDAVRDGLADQNPFYNQRLNNTPDRDLVVLTDQELQRLVGIAGAEWGEYGAAYLGPMILTAAFTGMRPGELFALRLADVDWEGDFITVDRQWNSRINEFSRPKSGKARTVPLLPQAAAALKQVPPPALREESLFRTKQGKPFMNRMLQYYWNPVRTAFWHQLPAERRERIPKGMEFYELRHYFGTLLARHNFSPVMIAKAMGHNDGGQTAQRHYIRLSEDDARRAIVEHFRAEQVGLGSGTGSGTASRAS